MATRIIEFVHPESLFPALPRKVKEQPAFIANASPQNSLGFDSATGMVCVQSDEAVSVSLLGDASANSYRIQASAEQFWLVQPGQQFSIRT